MLNKTRSWLLARRGRAVPPARADQGLAIPAERMTRMYVSLKRRLTDKIENVLEEACVIGDLQTAEELLQVLEYMQVRQPLRNGPDRRAQADRLASLRAEVHRQQHLRAARSHRSANRFAGV
ncbi:MAG TPA: hypothetical protein VNE67_04545 [Acetobacteraceae bacterium]|nr:hypothetical protein [Acetobacteraceae bacterium]